MVTEQKVAETGGLGAGGDVSRYRDPVIVTIIALVAAVGALAAAMFAGGVLAEKVIPGLGDAGTATRWGLPAARLLMDLTAVLTVGALLAAAVLVPLVPAAKRRPGAAKEPAGPVDSDGENGGNGENGKAGKTVKPVPGLSEISVFFVRSASWLAAGWAFAAAATLVFTVSDILGEPVGQILQGNELTSYAGQLPQGTALMLVMLFAILISLLARTTVSPAGAMGLLVFSLVTLLPPPLTGHSSAAANHSVAVTSLAIHVLALALWTGGLVAVAAYVRWRPADRPELPGVVASRFSRLALWCYLAVGLSGLANVMSRLPSPADLTATPYGRLALAKMVAFAALGVFGWWHRGRTVKDLIGGKAGAFLRLAVAEVALMAATIGLAVGLARTAPPVSTTIDSPVKILIGYDMPPPLTFERLATLWRLDLFFAVVVTVLGGLYLAGLIRLWRRGDKWPIVRVIAWYVGLLTIVLVTQTGVATYAPIVFSVHMTQHMVLGMLTPIFLVLGGPITLALRAFKPAAVRGDRGPREWITAIVHGKVTGFYAHPFVATLLFMGSTYVLYFTGLFEAGMRSHLGHIAMMVHFLAAGTLFFWVIIGVDPAPKKLPPVGRLLVLFVTMPFHAFFGIGLMSMSEPIAKGWYTAMAHPWGDPILQDQHTGGAIAWGFGEIPTFFVLIALVFQWFFEDQRMARRRDRAADRQVADDRPDELADYNAYLASLEARGKRTGA